MSTARLVALTLFGIFVLAIAVAVAPPPHWKLCEFALLAAGLMVVRECIVNEDAETEMRRTRDPSGGGAFWSPASPAVARTSGAAVFGADSATEDIAQEMVNHAFRHVAMKYHPDRGGDPETMRRIYAAREIMLRAIRRQR